MVVINAKVYQYTKKHKFYTLKGRALQYVNYILIKLLLSERGD